MHMRVKKFAKPELAACNYYVDRPDLQKGHWRECFATNAPLYVELGCGKGISTAKMVYDNRNTNFIAIDMSPDILGVARRNMAEAFGEEKPGNILFTRWNIDYIDQIFSREDSADCIIINFCNPWTKRLKQAKRRLTSPQKLMMYRDFLQDGGEIRFKTDNDMLFEDSLGYFDACGFECITLSRDLHAAPVSPDYRSEHEQLYVSMGIPIKYGVFRKKPGEVSIDPKLWLLEKNAEKKETATLTDL